MLIDWFTIAAQIVNFLILIWLLQRFLYGPIVRAMETREQRIQRRMRDAEQQRAEAEQAAQEYRSRLDDLEQRRAELLAAAQAEADQRRLELIEKARVDAERLRARWQKAIRRNQQTFLTELSRRSGLQVIAIARRVLSDVAEADLEKQIIGMFLQRLWQIDPAEQAILRGIQSRSQQPVIFRSAFALPAAQRQRIASVVHELLGEHLTLEFETAPDLICGVSLVIGGREISWGVQSYLETLEEHFVQALTEEAHAGETVEAGQPAVEVEHQ